MHLPIRCYPILRDGPTPYSVLDKSEPVRWLTERGFYNVRMKNFGNYEWIEIPFVKRSKMPRHSAVFQMELLNNRNALRFDPHVGHQELSG